MSEQHGIIKAGPCEEWEWDYDCNVCGKRSSMMYVELGRSGRGGATMRTRFCVECYKLFQIAVRDSMLEVNVR